MDIDHLEKVTDYRGHADCGPAHPGSSPPSRFAAGGVGGLGFDAGQ